MQILLQILSPMNSWYPVVILKGRKKASRLTPTNGTLKPDEPASAITARHASVVGLILRKSMVNMEKGLSMSITLHH